ncbi:predicted protein [Thalassiosira pseudonana CCMP1335]|uniref:Uncharacterized protein n=1 Tax=Thalassiosira pseudonana TaxID=35128 RepID=B8BZZ3_THAPS|nr:predicted protein [Thalassiosira pseudonana CCMP1335]EED92971.1 predicted protein [Thalassiosira pseudonana CCMP1335]
MTPTRRWRWATAADDFGEISSRTFLATFSLEPSSIVLRAPLKLGAFLPTQNAEVWRWSWLVGGNIWPCQLPDSHFPLQQFVTTGFPRAQLEGGSNGTKNWTTGQESLHWN